MSIVETRWTNGPWYVTPDATDDELCFISSSQAPAPFPTNWIACCCTGLDEEEWKANAQIIAAAPDLYNGAIDSIQNLEKVLALAQSLSSIPDELTKSLQENLVNLKAATQKAQGRQS